MDHVRAQERQSSLLCYMTAPHRREAPLAFQLIRQMVLLIESPPPPPPTCTHVCPRASLPHLVLSCPTWMDYPQEAPPEAILDSAPTLPLTPCLVLIPFRAKV